MSVNVDPAATTTASGAVTLAGTNIGPVSITGLQRTAVQPSQPASSRRRRATQPRRSTNPVQVGIDSARRWSLPRVTPLTARPVASSRRSAGRARPGPPGRRRHRRWRPDRRPQHQLRRRLPRPVSAPITLLGGAAIGMAAGSLLVPFTRRELAAVGRSVVRPGWRRRAAPTRPWRHLGSRGPLGGPRRRLGPAARLRAAPGRLVDHRLPAAAAARRPRPARLLRPDPPLAPQDAVYALSAAVIVSGVISPASCTSGSVCCVASLGGLAFFGLFFVMNLMNPRWMAFGDVRLSLVVGFGLAWVSPVALLEGFFFANLLAAVIGLCSSPPTGPTAGPPCPSACSWLSAPHWC